MYQHICKNCGKLFENYKKKQSFCSLACRNSVYRDRALLKSKELIGKKFGKLVIVNTKIVEKQRTKCLCMCECGNKVWVSSANLKNGHTTSCGCYQKETALDSAKRAFEQYSKENLIQNTNISRLVSQKGKNNTSGIKGVYWHTQNQKWRAKLTFQKNTYVKDFIKKEDAIKYRKELEEKYFKPILDKNKKLD